MDGILSRNVECMMFGRVDLVGGGEYPRIYQHRWEGFYAIWIEVHLSFKRHVIKNYSGGSRLLSSSFGI